MRDIVKSPRRASLGFIVLLSFGMSVWAQHQASSTAPDHDAYRRHAMLREGDASTGRSLFNNQDRLASLMEAA